MAVFISAFLLGIGSSFHCLGMCGPLVIAIPMKGKGKSGRTFGMIQYHFGKTLTYALLGLVIGIIGWSVQTFKWMQALSIVSGILIIVFAWGKYIRFSVAKGFQQNVISKMGKWMNKLFRSEIPFKPFFFGFINGFLPCGLVYIALINSLLAPNALTSSLAMVFFGLGTVPILTFAKIISNRIQWKTNRWMPIFITIVGILIILRGLNLGIPYVSPKMNTPVSTNIESDMTNSNAINCH